MSIVCHICGERLETETYCPKCEPDNAYRRGALAFYRAVHRLARERAGTRGVRSTDLEAALELIADAANSGSWPPKEVTP